MRPETILILSSIDVRTLAEFSPELDPCVNEALRNEEVINATGGVGVQTAGNIRRAGVNAREEVAMAIQSVTIPQAVAITNPTVIHGVVIPKIESGMPQIPVVIPSLVLERVEIRPESTNMIEFQEIIPGIKPPSIPSLIPGLEKLPLLPGWTIRDPAGKILNEGMRMPLVPPIGATGITIPPELPQEGELAAPVANSNTLHPDAVTLEKLIRDPIAAEEEIADEAVELGLDLDDGATSLDEGVEL
jgi:hypothetical protein